MFKIHDERAAIRRIQEYLHFIRDRTYPELPPLSPDGIYGEETRIAVKEFQRMVGVSESGIVDMETNEAIFLKYQESLEIEPVSHLDVEEFPVSLGSTGKAVEALNSQLITLRKVYLDLPRLNNDGYFGKMTEKAIVEIEKIFRYSPSGIVDSALYNRIVKEALLIDKKINASYK